MASTSDSSASTPFLGYVHNYRSAAILLIVAGHVFASLDWNGSTSSRAIDALLFDNVSVFFVVISGLLFRHLVHRYEPARFFSTRIKYVLLPYLIMSLPVIAIRIMGAKTTSVVANAHPEFTEHHPLYQAGYYLITGAHLRPYWFIPVIALFYLASPVLRQLDRHPKLYLPVLAASLAMALSIPRPGPLAPLASFAHFLPAYVLGMYLSYTRHTLLPRVSSAWLPATLIVVVVSTWSTLYPSSITTFVQKSVVSVWALAMLHRAEPWFTPRIGALADYSFALFSIHDYIDLGYKSVLQWFTGATVVPGTLASFSVLLALTLSASLLVVTLARQLFGPRSRLLVGA